MGTLSATWHQTVIWCATGYAVAFGYIYYYLRYAQCHSTRDYDLQGDLGI